MIVFWIINPLTKEDLPVKVFDTPEEALEFKDNLRNEYPDIYCFYTINNGMVLDETEILDMEEVIGQIQQDV